MEPEKPMRPLHWQRLLLTDDAMAVTIWAEVPPSVSIPRDSLVSHFAAVPSSSTMRRRTSGAAEAASKSVLPSKRREAVDIVARGLPDATTLARGLAAMDEASLGDQPASVLNRLLPVLPTTSELSALSAASSLETDAERFLAALGKVPAVEARTRCWDFSFTFRPTHDQIAPRIDALRDALGELMNSQALPVVLGMIREVGNYMNAGNVRRGRADGFNIALLGTLDELRSNQKDVSMLAWLVNTKDPAVLGLPRQLSRVTKVAKRVDLRELELEVRDLATTVSSLSSQCERVVEAVEPDDPFVAKMPPFFAAASDRTKALSESLAAALTQFAELREYFCAPASLSCSEFLSCFAQLAAGIEKIVKKKSSSKHKKAAAVKVDVASVLENVKAGRTDQVNALAASMAANSIVSSTDMD